MSSTSQGDQSSCHLRKHSKIVSYSGGNFTLHHENLAKLTNSLDAAKFEPVALISVIGPAGSGKSFYTNLLIHYFKHGGGGGWMTNLSSVSSKALNIEPLLGFSYGNVYSHNNIAPYSDSGIYVWPEAFRVSNYNGSTIVWVLNVHLTEDDRRDEAIIDFFNILLNLLSSKIVEIKWKNDDEFAFLETRQKLLNSNLPRAVLCNGVVQLCRTLEKPKKVIISEDTDAVEHLQKLIPETLSTSLDTLECVRVAHITDNDKPIHDQNGFLTLQTKEMHEQLDKTIKLVGEYNDIKPKLDMNGHIVYVYGMEKYVLSCVGTLNQEIMKYQKNRVPNTTFGGCSSFSSPPCCSHRSTNIEGNSPKLYPDTKEDLTILNSSNASPKSSPNANPFEVYGANTSSVTSYTCEEVCGSKEKNLGFSEKTKEQALRKEKINNNNFGGNQFLSSRVVSEPNSNASTSSTVCPSEKVKKNDLSFEGEPMDIEDNTSIENAAKNVEEHEKQKQEDEAKRIFQEQSRKQVEEEEKLKAKFEREEKLRLEKEEKKAHKEKIEKSAIEASVEIEAGMLKELNRWIDNTLTPATYNECGKMYEQQFLKVKNDKKRREVLSLRQSDIAVFNKAVQEKTGELRMSFEKIQEFIIKFHSSINRNTEMYGCFTESSFKEFIGVEFNRIRDASGIRTNEELLKYASRACEKLANTYCVQNQNRITQEQFLLRLQYESIINAYSEVMCRGIEKCFFSPAQLLYIHSQLIRKLFKSITTAFRVKTTEHSQFLLEIFEGMRRHLEEKFKRYKIENRLKLEKLQRELSKLLQSSKAGYDGTMDKALRDNCTGLPLQDFMNIHATALEEAKESLKKGIQEKVGKVEKVEVHIKTLQNHIDNAWPSLMDENAANLKNRERRQQQDVEMAQAQRNESVQETRTATKPVFGSSQSLSSPACSSKHSSSTLSGPINSNVKKCLPEIKQQPSRPCLSPLIFHLSLNHVRAGIHHENEFLPSEPTPAIVGVTNDNQWVCGEDLQHDSSKVWLVRECLHPWKEDVKIGDSNHKITVEFLLGYLFQAQKLKFEEMLNEDISKAIIIIPYWFTSSQRRLVKDAGTIAGFNETLLINENTAIALHYAIKKCNESTEIVVLCENSGNVDVTVYDYDKETLKMQGHSSVYEKKDKKKKANPGVLTRGLNYIWGSFTSGSEVSDGTLNNVKEAYKLAMSQADSLKKKSDRSRPKHVLFSFEFENWKDILVRTAGGILDKKHSASAQCIDIMAGIGSITRNRFSVYQIIQDLMNSNIYMKSPSYDLGKVVLDNKKILPFNGLEGKADLPIYTFKARFFQKGIAGDVDIGQLEFHPPYPEDEYVKLEVNNEGIVNFLSVNPKPKNRTRGSGIADKPPYSDSRYTWFTPNLKNEEVGVFASLLECFKKAKKALVASSETELAKQSLFEKGRELTYRIENNEGKFRSDLGRTMVNNQIMEALELLKHPKITTNDIEKQMELFHKLEAKYFPQ